MMTRLLAAALFCALMFAPTLVRSQTYDRHAVHQPDYSQFTNARYSPASTRARPNRAAVRVERGLSAGLRVAHVNSRAPVQIIGGRPAGCPHRFCGCALSLKLFGKIIPTLNLAANWKGFPSAAPAPGMVAARHGHVFQLEKHVSGNVWTVWDANSGGGRIRIHNRSIAGYTIHNPSGAIASQAIPRKRYAKRKYRTRYAGA